ncbi:hypothetical protein BT69DRAFT_1278456 [Atractiella rhizophila]|nr:hypothetical protein BT69DRAFT_1278456 [Atractiella rhizophila]
MPHLRELDLQWTDQTAFEEPVQVDSDNVEPVSRGESTPAPAPESPPGSPAALAPQCSHLLDAILYSKHERLTKFFCCGCPVPFPEVQKILQVYPSLRHFSFHGILSSPLGFRPEISSRNNISHLFLSSFHGNNEEVSSILDSCVETLVSLRLESCLNFKRRTFFDILKKVGGNLYELAVIKSKIHDHEGFQETGYFLDSLNTFVPYLAQLELSSGIFNACSSKPSSFLAALDKLPLGYLSLSLGSDVALPTWISELFNDLSSLLKRDRFVKLESLGVSLAAGRQLAFESEIQSISKICNFRGIIFCLEAVPM